MTKVLDHGYVELLDHLGDDARVIEAARVCVGKAGDVANPETYIQKLWQSGHTSPFEQVVFTYRIKAPIFVARQWMRHRTARINELSMRYTTAGQGDAIEFYIPPDERLGDHPDTAAGYLETLYISCRNTYKTLLATHTPPEVARCVLPVSVYTMFVWQMDLHNLLHFLALRTAGGAQWETRQYAMAVADLARNVAPLSLKAAGI